MVAIRLYKFEGNHVYHVRSLLSKPCLNFVYKYLGGSKAVKQMYRAERTMYGVKMSFNQKSAQMA